MSTWKAPHNPANDEVTGRIIYKLTKKRSKSHLVYTECPEDSWFIWEYTLETKSNKIKNRNIFIAKDIPHVIGSRRDWELERVDEPLEESARI